MYCPQDLLSAVRHNARISLRFNFLAAAAMTLLTPFIFSLKLLTYNDMAKIGEIYLTMTGIILISCIGGIDERVNVHEISFIKPLAHVYIFALRMLTAFIVEFIMIACIMAVAELNGGDFPFWTVTSGVWISAVFFGLVGLTVVNIANDLAQGYIAAFIYFIFEWFTKGKYTGDFFVLSLLNGSFDEKYRILAVIAALTFGNILYVRTKS